MPVDKVDEATAWANEILGKATESDLNNLAEDRAKALASHDGLKLHELGMERLGITNDNGEVDSTTATAFMAVCERLKLDPAATLKEVGRNVIVYNTVVGQPYEGRLKPQSQENGK